MFSLLLSPLTRYLILGASIVMVALGIYGKIRADAIAEVEAKAVADALRRTQDAIRAGDAVDISPDRVRESDGFRRD